VSKKYHGGAPLRREGRYGGSEIRFSGACTSQTTEKQNAASSTATQLLVLYSILKKNTVRFDGGIYLVKGLDVFEKHFSGQNEKHVLIAGEA